MSQSLSNKPKHGIGKCNAAIGSKSDKKRKLIDDSVELSSTTNAEGQLMSRALSTFDASEQERFEAYRRSTFAGDAVSKFVSQCLLDASEDRYKARTDARHLVNPETEEGSSNSFGVRTTPRIENALKTRPSLIHRNNQDSGGGSDTTNGHQRLAQLVATDTAPEITVVVSTLAKNYAQRLIQAARAVATQKGKSLQDAIDPTDLLDAHTHRNRAGLDPGFFGAASSGERVFASGSGPMSNCNFGGPSYGNGGIAAAALGIVDRNQLKLDAALAAQEQYDLLVQSSRTISSGTCTSSTPPPSASESNNGTKTSDGSDTSEAKDNSSSLQRAHEDETIDVVAASSTSAQ